MTINVGGYGGPSGIPFIRGAVNGDILVWNDASQRWETQDGSALETRPWTDVRAARVNCVGDSNTEGGGSINIGAWRYPMYEALRNRRGDFNLIGTKVGIPPELGGFGMWRHDGYSGSTILGIQSIYAAIAAQLTAEYGGIDVIVDMIGTNDAFAGRTAAQMIADRATLEATYKAAAPNAIVLAIAPPPFVAGTAVGGNLAAWNAVLVTYRTSLRAFQLAQNGVGKPQHLYFDPSPLLNAGDFQTDGVHLNNNGYAKLGSAIAQYVDVNVLGQRRGQSLPQVLRQRGPMASEKCVANTDGLIVASQGFNPANKSFAVAIDYYPSKQSPAYTSIIGYGDFLADPANMWLLAQRTGHIDLFWQSNAGTGIFINQPCGRALQAQQWHRIVVIAKLNGANSSIGMYVNGELVGLVDGLPAWAFSAGPLNTQVGQVLPALGGELDSYYGNIYAWGGDDLPFPGSADALEAVEANYFQGANLFEGRCLAGFDLNAALTDTIFGNPAFAQVGGGAFAAASPGGTPLRPWEYPHPRLDNLPLTALGGGAAPTLGTIGGNGPAAAAQNAWAQYTDASGAKYWVPVWK